MSEPRIQCPGCFASFQTQDELEQHRRGYHGWYPGKRPLPTPFEAAATDLINQLTLLIRDDESYLWRIGGRPLDDAYKALKRMIQE